MAAVEDAALELDFGLEADTVEGRLLEFGFERKVAACSDCLLQNKTLVGVNI